MSDRWDDDRLGEAQIHFASVPLERAFFRLPADLKEQVQKQAAADGLDFSEWVRQALVARLAWQAAVRSVQAGADLESVSSFERVVELLGKIAQEEDRG